MSQKDRIYMDYAAATPVDDAVLVAMQPYWQEQYGNAGALHTEGQQAKAAIEQAREICAQAAHAHSDEIIFTSGGTEGNNFAIFGVVRALEKTGKKVSDMHFITTEIEHSSVRDCFRVLKEQGAEVTHLPTLPDGRIDPEDIKKNIRENTVLVSVMYVNNEIGTVLPISEVGKVVRAYRSEHKSAYPVFHVDACQAPLYLSCDVEKLGVDLMTVDGQKLYGPKGAGYLYQRRGTLLEPLLYGGNQERSMRPGTPVTPLIIGLAKAIELAEERREAETARLKALQEYFFERIEKEFAEAEINGSKEHRVPNNINVSFPGLDAESLLLQMDAKGIAISTRSACLFGTEGGSFVVTALGKDLSCATSSIRFTMGKGSTKEHVDRTIEALEEVVALARESQKLAQMAAISTS